YLRNSIIEEAGLELSDFTKNTWKTFNDLGIRVKEATGKPLLSIDMNDLGHMRMMMHSSGNWYTAEDGETPFIDGNP
ncbi:ABC transporter substrate-binding protein, partial [Enterococcus faecium]